jgi:hypothetical protein
MNQPVVGAPATDLARVSTDWWRRHRLSVGFGASTVCLASNVGPRVGPALEQILFSDFNQQPEPENWMTPSPPGVPALVYHARLRMQDGRNWRV